jgi:hypothetical protein
MTMTTTLKVLAAGAILATALSSTAFARRHCAPGYALHRGVCYRVHAHYVHRYGNPVSGAVSGAQSGANSGYHTAGPVGAVVGGAVGTAAGTLRGTANMLTGR